MPHGINAHKMQQYLWQQSSRKAEQKSKEAYKAADMKGDTYTYMNSTYTYT